MSTGQMQERNAQLVRLLSADLQLRYEPNFAWKSAISAYLALPGLRAFWPMSSVDYAAANRTRDLSGQGYHLTDNNTPTFNYDGLAPYVEFDGTNQYLSRADGGAANWSDITGTEAYIDIAARGLTMGGWFWFDTLGDFESPMGKWNIGGSRSYVLSMDTAANARMRFIVSVDCTAVSTVSATIGTLATTTWHFLVGTFDPSVDVILFHNDVEYNLGSAPASICDSTADFTVGSRHGGGLPIDGRASMCFLCAAYLSDAIILSLFEQTKAMFGVA